MTTTTIDIYASHIRRTLTLNAVEKRRMLAALQEMREMAQWGDSVPGIEELAQAQTAEDLAAMIGGLSPPARSQVEAEIRDDARQRMWHSPELKAIAQTDDVDVIDAMMEADRVIAAVRA